MAMFSANFSIRKLIAGSALAVGLFFSTPVSSANSNVHPAPGKYVWIGHYRLHIHCMGQGSPTVVLDSGLGGNSLHWVRVQPEVAKFTHVCSYDRAGYGWSDQRSGPRTSATITKELNKLLGYASVAAPYVLVGHSFGGFNVRLFASYHPKKTAGLVLIDSSHEAQFERLEAAGLTKLAPTGRQFVIGNHYQIPPTLPLQIRPLAQALAVQPGAIGSLYSELRHMRLSAHQVRAQKLLPDVPLIVIAHDSQRRAQTPRAQRMAKSWLKMQRDLAGRTRRGSFVLARESGHYIQLDQPQLVVEAIRSVVESNREVSCGKPQSTLIC